MKLIAIRIDERTWNEADDRRRAEWRAAMHELTADPELELLATAHTLRVEVSEQAIVLELVDGSEVSLARAIVPRDALAKHVTEYVDVVRRIEQAVEGVGSARVEALDMGKRMVHDDAAKVVEKVCAPLGVDHWTSRKLFTLLFALRVDTTRLVGYRAHRPVR